MGLHACSGEHGVSANGSTTQSKPRRPPPRSNAHAANLVHVAPLRRRPRQPVRQHGEHHAAVVRVVGRIGKLRQLKARGPPGVAPRGFAREPLDVREGVQLPGADRGQVVPQPRVGVVERGHGGRRRAALAGEGGRGAPKAALQRVWRAAVQAPLWIAQERAACHTALI